VMIMNKDKIIKDLKERNNNLQEENEKVHKDFAELSERYFFTKSRNEKAIEYNKQKLEDIKEEIITVTIYDKEYEKYVKEILNNNLNILQGSDDNETI